MDTTKFKHDAESIYIALGFTEDQYDEMIFKVTQIIKRRGESTHSEIAAACMKWAYNKFDSDELRAGAVFLMGQAVEKAQLITNMQEMMRGGLTDMLRKKLSDHTSVGSINFKSNENMGEFVSELKELVKEFNGEHISELDNEDFLAIRLDPNRKNEFIARLNALKRKHNIDEDVPFTMPFGGPIAEA